MVSRMLFMSVSSSIWGTLLGKGVLRGGRDIGGVVTMTLDMCESDDEVEPNL